MKATVPWGSPQSGATVKVSVSSKWIVSGLCPARCGSGQSEQHEHSGGGNEYGFSHRSLLESWPVPTVHPAGWISKLVYRADRPDASLVVPPLTIALS
jgi:hypothetical protein